jgi:uncharacterized OsmC-like protein
VLATAEPLAGTPPVIANRRGTISVISHDGSSQEDQLISPIEYVLSGLAINVIQSLNMVISQANLQVAKVFVAVSQERVDNKTNITCELIVDGDLTDDDRDLLKNAADNCPVRSILKAGASVKTVVA